MTLFASSLKHICPSDMDFLQDDISSEDQVATDSDDDDQIKDPESDRVFDEQLTRDVEQGTATTYDVDDSGNFGDEEKDSNDNGIGESDVSDIEGKLMEQPRMVAQVRILFA